MASNYYEVLHQMEVFGIKFRGGAHDDKGKIRTFEPGKRVTFGVGGKWWFKLYYFRPDRGGEYITGSFGSWKFKTSQKVDNAFKAERLSEAERARHAAEMAAAEEAARQRAEEAAQLAELKARELWSKASPEGVSPYLVKKGLQAAAESCRYMRDGTLVLLLLRYDLPREKAVKGAQYIRPDGSKLYSKDCAKAGAALRLGDPVRPDTRLVLVVEGYATGLTVRQATDCHYPVFVAFDAGGLEAVIPKLRALYPQVRFLVCADDDWKTVDNQTQQPNNPGRTKARKVAKRVPGVDLVYPIFDGVAREKGHTDFDDLRQLQGLEVVRRQLGRVVQMMEKAYG